MESKIIKAFFDGNLADEVITTPRTKEYTDIDERETAIYNKLRPMLTGEQLKLFDEFVDLYGDRHALISIITAILNSGEYFVLNFFSLDINICTSKSLSNFWGAYQIAAGLTIILSNSL